MGKKVGDDKITEMKEKWKKEAEALVISKGGSVLSSVTKTLTYLVVGDKAGSKLEKAKKLNTSLLNEDEFLAMMNEGA